MILTAMLDCAECGIPFEGAWHDDSMDAEQRDHTPVQEQICPRGHKFQAEYEGWSWTTEAG